MLAPHSRTIMLWTALATIVASLAARRFVYPLVALGAALFVTSLESRARRVPLPPGPPDGEALHYCQRPSEANPMANALPPDYDRPGKLPACPPDAVGRDVRTSFADLPLSQQVVQQMGSDRALRPGERAFYSMPSTTVYQDVAAYRRALYGSQLSRSIDHGFDQNIFSEGIVDQAAR